MAPALTVSAPEKGGEFDGLQYAVLDLQNMARLTADTIEKLFDVDPTPCTGRSDFFPITDTQSETALFAVYHLRKMVEEFHDRYYAVLEGKA